MRTAVNHLPVDEHRGIDPQAEKGLISVEVSQTQVKTLGLDIQRVSDVQINYGGCRRWTPAGALGEVCYGQPALAPLPTLMTKGPVTAKPPESCDTVIDILWAACELVICIGSRAWSSKKPDTTYARRGFSATFSDLPPQYLINHPSHCLPSQKRKLAAP